MARTKPAVMQPRCNRTRRHGTTRNVTNTGLERVRPALDDTHRHRTTRTGTNSRRHGVEQRPQVEGLRKRFASFCWPSWQPGCNRRTRTTASRPVAVLDWRAKSHGSASGVPMNESSRGKRQNQRPGGEQRKVEVEPEDRAAEDAWHPRRPGAAARVGGRFGRSAPLSLPQGCGRPPA
jgi:hypothetical protein